MNTFLQITIGAVLILTIVKDRLIIKHITNLTDRVRALEELEREDQ